MITASQVRKIRVVAGALILGARVALPQGEVPFDNRGNAFGTPGEFPGVVIAPFYNMDPSCPTCIKQGNTSSGSPVGNQTYNGSRLINDAMHSYTATLWAINTAQFTGDRTDWNNNLQLVGTTTMRTNTTPSNAGRVASLLEPVVVPTVTDLSQRATFQVRAWDSLGGAITTWDQVLADPSIPRGYSTVFDLASSLGGFEIAGPGSTPSSPPFLEGLQSFQLFIGVVPEPSVIALGALGAGCLFLFRRRN